VRGAHPDGGVPSVSIEGAPRARTAPVGIPELCLVVLVGVSGSGKSTFARTHFRPTEVISSDLCRALVSDDENDQTATRAAFEVLHTIAAKRLEGGRLTVVDATSVRPEDRKPLVELARRHHVLPVAIVLDVPPALCRERNLDRPDRNFGAHVVRNQHAALRRSVGRLSKEGFRRVFVLAGPEQIESAVIARERLWTDQRHLTGPFDIIGDVHGCHTELVGLLRELGWTVDADGSDARHPDGRMAVFLGDLVDRGPATPAVLRLAMHMVDAGVALCIPGNHEQKLQRALKGHNVQISHGLAESLAQLGAEPPEFRQRVERFIDGLVSHAVLDGGSLVVAHAGLPEAMHNRSSGAVRAFALYGDTTGETDEFGLPVRYPWARDYRGRSAVVYGHTPAREATWVNNTICLDTGCVFGGRLTALRWPERELVSVPATGVHYEPRRPLAEEPGGDEPGAVAGEGPAGHRATAQAGVAGATVGADTRPYDLLDVDDVLGKRIVEARLTGSVTIRAENATAALEVMSRFAVDPRWLVYLPPTMAPPPTSRREGLLEHPAEAFAQYRADGVRHVIGEEKHMGSRAVVVVCRDPEVAAARFGIDAPSGGVVVTRTGRPFFARPELEAALLDRIRSAFTTAGLWEELGSGWAVLDAELLPWSLKAEELLRSQYAAAGVAATASLAAEAEILAATAARFAAGPSGPATEDENGLSATRAAATEAGELAARATERQAMAGAFVEAYRRYCWPVEGLDGVAVAPFQLVAAEGEVHALRAHPWHLALAERLAAADGDLFRPTRAVEIDLEDPETETAAVAWWEELTAAGGEGMVVKPRDVVARSPKGRLVQPGIKCRGREYLRLIYGPEYTTPGQLARLRDRGLGHKRSLAGREFALGIEALERFVAAEPLYRVHECVFGVLALESEPVDPRL
jgi:protein phosphatase